MKKKGFTLIELLAVLVILAIIALITIPIVIRTINNSEEQTEKQSILGYARAIENYVQNDMIKNPGRNYLYYKAKLPFSDLEYKGNDVNCKKYKIDENGNLSLTCCKVTDGSGNGYDYKNGKILPNKQGICNNDAQDIDNNYKIGDRIKFEDDYYYVIADSDDTKEYVTVLKELPLTYAEVNKYGQNHINGNSSNLSGLAYNQNGYGAIQYYSSSDCNRTGSPEYFYCRSDYEHSDVKYVIDNWVDDKFDKDSLVEQDGYKSRLISFEELTVNLGFIWGIQEPTTRAYVKSEFTPDWVYNEKYDYWTMSSSYVNGYADTKNLYKVAVINKGYLSTVSINFYGINRSGFVIRPVINVLKQYVERVN